jgi:outer membrane protein assembly factor BamD
MYQKAMTHYKRMDRVDRDTTGAIEAIKLFDQLQRAYPDSPYAAEAVIRMQEATEFLADHEFAVVQFYVRTEKYSQAEKRLNYIITMYPEAKIIPQAKDLLAQLQEGNPPDAGIKEWLPSLPKLGWPELEE